MPVEYRYRLEREWGGGLIDTLYPNGRLCWVMLNPSTADDTHDDQTIRKITTITKRHHYSSLVVVNLFAMRATIPDELLTVAPGVARGDHNSMHVSASILESAAVVVAWGAWWTTQMARRNNPPDLPRMNIEGEVRKLGKPLYCLGRTADGSPRHPCRLPNDTKLEEF